MKEAGIFLSLQPHYDVYNDDDDDDYDDDNNNKHKYEV
jgi:hypothetical protein